MMREFSVPEISKLEKRFKAAQPFPHVVIENFMAGNDSKQLLSALKSEKFSRKDTDLCVNTAWSELGEDPQMSRR